MESPDSFFTIKAASEYEIKIKGSRFIGRAKPCADETEADKILSDIRKKFYDATHNCYAWRIGMGKNVTFKYSDDGEPSGTAGRPIYDQVEGRNMTNLIVIVTRYFGGTKLGTGGLTHAYSDCTAGVLDVSGSVERFIKERRIAEVQFPDYNLVERALHQYGANIIDSDFSDIIRLNFEIRKSGIEELEKKLVNLTAGRIKIESGV